MKIILVIVFAFQVSLYSQNIIMDTTIKLENLSGYKMLDFKETFTFNSDLSKQNIFSITNENKNGSQGIQLLSLDDNMNINWQNNYHSNNNPYQRKFVEMDNKLHLFVGETNILNEVNSEHNLTNIEINSSGQFIDTIKTKEPIDNYYNTFYGNIVLKQNSNIINIYRNNKNDIALLIYNPVTMEKISDSKVIKKFDPIKKLYDYPQDAISDEEGNIYFFSTQFYNTNFVGISNTIIYKVNPNLEITSEVLVQTDSSFFPTKLIITDNKLVLQSLFFGYHIFDLNSNMIKKVNIKVDNSQYSIVYNDIIYSKKSGFIATGYDLYLNKKYYFVAKFDDDFNLVWKKELDEGIKSYYFAKLSFLNKNTYLFSNVASDSTIVLKVIYDETVSVENETPYSNETNIFPNPAKTNVSIDFIVEPENMPNVKVELYNLTGILQSKLEYSVDYNNSNGQGTLNCNIENIQNGYYIITIDNGKRKIAKPFIVNRD